MNWSLWHKDNLEQMRRSSPHGWEERFSREVLQLIDGLNFAHVDVQVPFGDPRGKRRSMDFAIVEPPNVRLAIEVDDLETHEESQITSERFGDHLARQNELALEGYSLLRFTIPQLRDTPMKCVAQIQTMLGRLRRYGGPGPNAMTGLGTSGGLGRILIEPYATKPSSRVRRPPSCESCGDRVSDDEIEYCRDYAWLFRNRVLCIGCQDELFPYR